MLYKIIRSLARFFAPCYAALMDGIIVATDQTQEWLLPWWWGHYRKSNAFPVAFIDLGMSFEKKTWCKERGELIPLRVVDFAKTKEEVDPIVAKELEKEFGTRFWDSRDAWFKKPLACLLSPFQRTLWIDLDCEIRGLLNPLFAYADDGLAMAPNQFPSPHPYPMYNSGVIAFRQRHPLLKEWTESCYQNNHLFQGDQEVFSHMIAEKGLSISVLPPIYNWGRCQEENPEALILHWHGHYGKCAIQHALREWPE